MGMTNNFSVITVESNQSSLQRSERKYLSSWNDKGLVKPPFKNEYEMRMFWDKNTKSREHLWPRDPHYRIYFWKI